MKVVNGYRMLEVDINDGRVRNEQIAREHMKTKLCDHILVHITVDGEKISEKLDFSSVTDCHVAAWMTWLKNQRIHSTEIWSERHGLQCILRHLDHFSDNHRNPFRS